MSTRNTPLNVAKKCDCRRGTCQSLSRDDCWFRVWPSEEGLVHLDLCASQDDTMAGYPNCDCGAHQNTRDTQWGEEYDLTKDHFDNLRSEVRRAIGFAKSAAGDLTGERQDFDAQIAIDGLAWSIAYIESVAVVQFERGRRRGMTQERALWVMSQAGQEIESAALAPPSQVAVLQLAKEAFTMIVKWHSVIGEDVHSLLGRMQRAFDGAAPAATEVKSEAP